MRRPKGARRFARAAVIGVFALGLGIVLLLGAYFLNGSGGSGGDPEQAPVSATGGLVLKSPQVVDVRAPVSPAPAFAPPEAPRAAASLPLGAAAAPLRSSSADPVRAVAASTSLPGALGGVVSATIPLCPTTATVYMLLPEVVS